MYLKLYRVYRRGELSEACSSTLYIECMYFKFNGDEKRPTTFDLNQILASALNLLRSLSFQNPAFLNMHSNYVDQIL